jgi:hypothetical protein
MLQTRRLEQDSADLAERRAPDGQRVQQPTARENGEPKTAGGRSANWLVTGNDFECHAETQTVAL